MKSSELNKFILKNGWRAIRQSGSHIIYEKNGLHYTATFHGSKEVGKGLEMKIKKGWRSRITQIYNNFDQN